MWESSPSFDRDVGPKRTVTEPDKSDREVLLLIQTGQAYEFPHKARHLMSPICNRGTLASTIHHVLNNTLPGLWRTVRRWKAISKETGTGPLRDEGSAVIVAQVVATIVLFLFAIRLLGGAAVVVFIGGFDFLDEEVDSLRESMRLGVPTFLLTHSIYLPVIALGYVALPAVRLGTGHVRCFPISQFRCRTWSRPSPTESSPPSGLESRSSWRSAVSS